MGAKKLAQEAVENAYQSYVGELFRGWVDSLVTNGGATETVRAAEERFKTGLDLADLALKRATDVINL